MDAPGPVEPDEPDELERLRRRAYGPGADIAGDTAARARLAALEAAQHRPVTPVVGAVPAPVPERDPLRDPGDGARSASTSVPPPVVGASVEHDPAKKSVAERDPAQGTNSGSDAIDGAPAARRRRRRLAILGVAIAGVVLNAALVAWMWPRAPEYLLEPDFVHPPDFVLALEAVGAEAEPKDPHGTLNRLGLNADEMRRYENFGYLSVWSGESRYGTTCLLVAHPVQGLNDGIHAEACSPAGLDTIADLLQLPPESLTRFVLKDERVDVYVYGRATDPIAPEG